MFTVILRFSSLPSSMNRRGLSKFTVNSLLASFSRFEILRSNHGKFISINSKNSFVEVSDQWLQKFLNDSIIQNISIGIRPKDISRAIGKNSDSMRFKGKLSFIERLGDETIFEFMLLDESVIHVVNSTLDTPSLKIGSELILETEYNNILLFDSDTGNRIYQI